MSDLKTQGFIRIGDDAPDFKTKSQDGETISWHDYINGSWAVLMSHPRDFTPVCTTEIGRVAQLKDEWAKRGVKVAVVSVDSWEEHKAWIEEINRVNNTTVNFPIFDDKDKKISVLYGMLDQTHLDAAGMPLTVRSVFVIGPDKKVKLIITYPASCGRSFDEILRVIDSLQLTANRKLATPADWTPGKECTIIPTVTDEEAATLFPGYKVVSASCKLRTIADPTKPSA